MERSEYKDKALKPDIKDKQAVIHVKFVNKAELDELCKQLEETVNKINQFKPIWDIE